MGSAPISPYEQGYRLGYRIEKTFQRSLALGIVARAEIERRPLCNATGHPLDAAPQAEHWLGYAHGIQHAKTGAPLPAAEGRVPESL